MIVRRIRPEKGRPTLTIIPKKKAVLPASTAPSPDPTGRPSLGSQTPDREEDPARKRPSFPHDHGKKSESEHQPPLNGSMSMISTAILLPFGAL
jgi:hypothetical protein